MSVADIMKKRRVLSFEVFPPRTQAGMDRLCGENGVLKQLYDLNPDYISCTYGAGGTNVGMNRQVLSQIVRDGRTVPVTHFTCVNNTREEILRQLQSYLDRGVNHMLALRGDLPAGMNSTGGDLQYAVELVKFTREHFGNRFTIAVGGSPEGHIDSARVEDDIRFLKQKQDAGADFIVTQLCWDIDRFRRWMDAIRAAGIWLPVDAGIMPVLDQAATINMSLSRNGCSMPGDLCRIISRNWIFPNPFAKDAADPETESKKAAFRAAGMEYTIGLVRKYLDSGVSGIHLYALNRHEDVAIIAREVGFVRD